MSDSIPMADLIVDNDPAPGNPFKIGDSAYHKYHDLDGRSVVSVKGKCIRIQIGTLASDWLDADNYDRGDR